jgi:hypothetical protein
MQSFAARGQEKAMKQTKPARSRIVHQGPDDVVVQKHVRTPRNVDVDHAQDVPDNDWEVGTEAEQLEQPKKP